jgi:isochorismate hydrolase
MVKRGGAYMTRENAKAKVAQWLALIRSSVPTRTRLSLEPRRCALLVVDMLRYFAHPLGRAWLPASAAVLPNVVALLEAWRGLGAPVFFTRHCHEGPQDLGMLGRFFADYIRSGEPESEIVEELRPRPDEPVVRKTTYDAFHATPLEALVRQAGASQVLVCGVLTHMCCETTARAAFVRGFEVYAAADAMASHSEQTHVGSLLNQADSVAVVLSTAEVLAACRKSA